MVDPSGFYPIKGNLSILCCTISFDFNTPDNNTTNYFLLTNFILETEGIPSGGGFGPGAGDYVPHSELYPATGNYSSNVNLSTDRILYELSLPGELGLDPNGVQVAALDTVADAGFVAWDVGSAIGHAFTGNFAAVGVDLTSAGANVACTFIPFATGCGLAARAAAKLKVAPPHRVVNALRGFRSVDFRIGNDVFKLDKSNFRHILEGHHANYWAGFQNRELVTLFPKNFSPDDVLSAIKAVVNQNRNNLSKIGTSPNSFGTIEGQYKGIKYVLGVRPGGQIGQFFPLP